MPVSKFCYIHIPFCESKCKYCRFASIGSVQEFQIEKYVRFLIKEIENYTSSEIFLETIYFGGGTPSTLKASQVLNIFSALRGKFKFSESIEISFESTPQNISSENIAAWRKIGINRLSMGVQSLNNETLNTISRKNNAEIFSALDSLTESGFKNTSIDFIIGLPHVKKGGVLDDIKLLLEKYSCIKHISVYMLEDYYEDISEDKTGKKENKYENISYPSDWSGLGIFESDYLGEYLEIKLYLEKQGFNRYEISNFSKQGYECLHNQAYWNHSDMIAFGLGAHGYKNIQRYSNSIEFSEYYAGKNIAHEILSENDVFIEKIMFYLRTSGIPRNLLVGLNEVEINAFIKSGFLIENKNTISLGNKGTVFLDHILEKIL